MTYTVLNCLGASVGAYNTIEDTMQAVLKQIPITPRTQRQMTARLSKARPGAEVYQDYGDCQIIVIVK